MTHITHLRDPLAGTKKEKLRVDPTRFPSDPAMSWDEAVRLEIESAPHETP